MISKYKHTLCFVNVDCIANIVILSFDSSPQSVSLQARVYLPFRQGVFPNRTSIMSVIFSCLPFQVKALENLDPFKFI